MIHKNPHRAVRLRAAIQASSAMPAALTTRILLIRDVFVSHLLSSLNRSLCAEMVDYGGSVQEYAVLTQDDATLLTDAGLSPHSVRRHQPHAVAVFGAIYNVTFPSMAASARWHKWRKYTANDISYPDGYSHRSACFYFRLLSNNSLSLSVCIYYCVECLAWLSANYRLRTARHC